jgi:hypothetical protein
MLLTLLLLPLAYVAGVVVLWATRRREALALSLAVFVGTLAAGGWAILQSRSSTAGIGFIFLPILAAVAGGLVLAFGASRRTNHGALRVLGVVALASALVPAASELVNARRTIERNAVRDADQARRDSAIVQYRRELDTLISHAGDAAADTLNVLLRARSADREFVLAALERDRVSQAMLDTLGRSNDLGLALQAVRNPNASAAMLARVYRTSAYPAYFYQALTAHAHTPPEILREIHRLHPAPISGLDISFAGNPSAPRDVLLDVARTSESIDAIRTLLRNPALDCAMVDAASASPAVRTHGQDAEVPDQLRELHSTRCR